MRISQIYTLVALVLFGASFVFGDPTFSPTPAPTNPPTPDPNLWSKISGHWILINISTLAYAANGNGARSESGSNVIGAIAFGPQSGGSLSGYFATAMDGNATDDFFGSSGTYTIQQNGRIFFNLNVSSGNNAGSTIENIYSIQGDVLRLNTFTYETYWRRGGLQYAVSSPTTAPTPTPTPTPSPCRATATATAKPNSSWMSNGQVYNSYDITIKNSGTKSINSFKITLTGGTMDSYWNINPLGNNVWNVNLFGNALQVGETRSGQHGFISYGSSTSVTAVTVTC